MADDDDPTRSQQRQQAVRCATPAGLAAFRRVDAHDADALAVQPERIAVDDSQWQRAVDDRRARCVLTRERHRWEHDDDDERETDSTTHDTLIVPRRTQRVDVQSSRQRRWRCDALGEPASYAHVQQ
ncbi:MAG: hypothetical protein AUH30_06665 [Candidatus Rokubacteria bacterium 13_1_40CM_68_15]|nr:MAG: hypothetical protein AUH30_06665 [Candidatus Rokubacteria bacterium 13_1_40CM_68_15]